jgi:uncharacterized damage-inducible protein DinB
MKELIQQYAAYNVWAHKRILDCCKQLSDEKLKEEVVSSFKSIYQTVNHLMDAENAWWQRLKLVENINIDRLSFTGTFNELGAALLKFSNEWKQWVDGANVKSLEHVFGYTRDKQYFKMPVYIMLQHLFNHATLHRGQIITMLRQYGVTNIPSTDFSTFYFGLK